METLIVLIYVLLFLLVLGAVFYFAKAPGKNTNKVDTASIQISVENKQVKKDRATENNEIIKEAESHFKTLSLKNPYSPLPFKVMAEFYMKNNLNDEAIKKCEQMIPYLNKDLDMAKLTGITQFLAGNLREDLSEKIITFYNNKG